MKQLLLVCFALSFWVQSVGQNIPDPFFAKAIRNYCPSCIDGANNLTQAAKELRSLTVGIAQINDLTGIAAFSNLAYLNCEQNNLQSLSALPNTLQTLVCSKNPLKSLGELPTRLTTLRCVDNQLTKLPTLPVNLKLLDCSNNRLTELPDLPPNLDILLCTNNNLRALPTLPNLLTGLLCSYNNLKTLPKLPTILVLLSCQNNFELQCLPILPDGLETLGVPNSIVCLPNLVKNLTINRYEDLTPKPVTLPICNAVQNALCPRLEEPPILDKKIRIFPNPTEGVLEVKTGGSVLQKITVFDAVGRLRWSQEVLPLTLVSLPQGVYFVKIETADATVLEKITKF